MLSERCCQLLTAYVDGELSARQRRQVARLLRRSPVARQLLRQLQSDSRTLRALSSPALDADLSGAVLQTIAARGLRPRRPVRARAPLSIWTGLAAAAAVLLLLGSVSYFYFAWTLPAGPDNSVARKGPDPNAGSRDQLPKDPVSPIPKGTSPTPEGPGPRAPEKNPEPERIGPPEEKDPYEGIAFAPAPLPKPEPETPKPEPRTILTDPGTGMEIYKLQLVEVAAPLLLALRDLDKEPVRNKLLAELGKDGGFRLELPCPDGTRAFERLQAVCKSANVNLLIEQVAQARLKKPNWMTSYVLILENTTPPELAQLLQQLNVLDRQAAAKRPADGQFDRLVVSHLNKTSRKELLEMLGTELTPLHASAAKPAEKQTALALTLPPIRPAYSSPEIKHFLEGRKPARPGAIQVLLVLRNVGS